MGLMVGDRTRDSVQEAVEKKCDQAEESVEDSVCTYRDYPEHKDDATAKFWVGRGKQNCRGPKELKITAEIITLNGISGETRCEDRGTTEGQTDQKSGNAELTHRISDLPKMPPPRSQ